MSDLRLSDRVIELEMADGFCTNGTAITQPEQLRDRTKQFAIRIVNLVRSLPRSDLGRTLGRQALRSGTSVAANYRAVCRARSRAEFIAKLGIVLEEADETAFWLELLIETGIVQKQKIEKLLKETNELIRIFAASKRTVARHSAVQSPNHPIAK